MARTINGNMAGRAARLDRQDQQDARQAAWRAEYAELVNLCSFIEAEMGADYEVWRIAGPDRNSNFLAYARQTAGQIEQAASPIISGGEVVDPRPYRNYPVQVTDEEMIF